MDYDLVEAYRCDTASLGRGLAPRAIWIISREWMVPVHIKRPGLCARKLIVVYDQLAQHVDGFMSIEEDNCWKSRVTQ